ncbi:MAG: serine hydrolase, partial [Anaerolineae bacterium]|nr:serine hydrolase [Anaerolineae bacterium]
ELIKLQFRDAPTSGGTNVLSGVSVREMHAPVLMSADWSSGISVGYSLRRVGGQTMVGKSGEIPGYTSFMGFIPELKLGAAVFVNANTQPLQLVTMMLETLIPVVKRLSARSKAPAPAVDAATIALWQRKYVGRYTSLLGEVEVVLRDGGLWMVGTGVALAETTGFIPEGPNAFRMTAGISRGEIAHFIEDAQGNVTRLMLGTIGVTRV